MFLPGKSVPLALAIPIWDIALFLMMEHKYSIGENKNKHGTCRRWEATTRQLAG